MLSLLPEFDRVGSVVASLRRSTPGQPWKPRQDLDRYDILIADTGVEVVVETGTHRGSFATWLADRDVDVVTVDNAPQLAQRDPRVVYLVGGSTDAAIVAMVAERVAGRRCMVSLDSDHSAAHVTAEIDAYGPLVSPGCHLVVEDTIWGYASDRDRQRRALRGVEGTPLDAVVARLVDDPGWERDETIEAAAPVSNAPAGWWRRRA